MEIITNLVELIDNEPQISHRVIAEQTQNLERSIPKLITSNIDKFELFDRMRFKIEGEFEIKEQQKLNPNYRPAKTFYLNEQQATLLISMMRNNDIVLDFKVRLVGEFFRMRELLQNQKPQIQTSQLPEIGNSTEQIIELDNNFTATTNLLANLRNANPIDLFRLDKFYRKFHNFSVLEYFEIELDSQFFLPTELGKMINKSPVEINLMLAHKGFQVKENGIWKMTSSGEEFGIAIVGKFNQIKWKIKTIV